MGKTAKILIVDDEPAICEMVSFSLMHNGFLHDEARNAEQARAIILSQPPDLILLDWMLPGQSGIDLARFIKRDNHTKDIAIIMLSARGEESDKVQGLETGADDYITKPFSPRELMARIKAVLRRTAPTASKEAIEINGLNLEPNSHRVSANGQFLELGPTEFNLLHFFMTHQERVYSRDHLIDLVWGKNSYVEERTVDVHIQRLRKALETSGHNQLIQTVRGAGYRMSLQK